ncbi:hypothetical protein GLYMA_08G256350v4 [Glycine max]|nr:hypothetical protein GLYMA_08G256350v4 [Glycine max]KAH1053085.1 hypothetical protein GYH30_022396 [Glycine max]
MQKRLPKHAVIGHFCKYTSYFHILNIMPLLFSKFFL